MLDYLIVLSFVMVVVSILETRGDPPRTQICFGVFATVRRVRMKKSNESNVDPFDLIDSIKSIRVEHGRVLSECSLRMSIPN